ncbi:unnamed protein product [Paramecium octaurelia]|uniref:Uncharacterized protein n=1 Tax=Paramecium octaurelia TaxID=43137 RepID=A0A8S1VCC9_PAROT|nr:unnamed protein product [Paramecium octaurelia]
MSKQSQDISCSRVLKINFMKILILISIRWGDGKIQIDKYN